MNFKNELEKILYKFSLNILETDVVNNYNIPQLNINIGYNKDCCNDNNEGLFIEILEDKSNTYNALYVLANIKSELHKHIEKTINDDNMGDMTYTLTKCNCDMAKLGLPTTQNIDQKLFETQLQYRYMTYLFFMCNKLKAELKNID